MVSVGEAVSTNQPAVWHALTCEYRLRPPDFYRRVAALKMQQRKLKRAETNWQAVMQERPKPGRGGLLFGEKGVYL